MLAQLLGGLCGFGFLVFLLIFLSTSRLRKRRRVAMESMTFDDDRRESVHWLNLFLARMNSSKCDGAILSFLCSVMTTEFENAPSKPAGLKEITVKLNKPAKSAVCFNEFTISASQSNAVSCSTVLSFQGSPAFAFSATSSTGPTMIPNLFICKIEIEFVLELLIATASLTVDDKDELWFGIGNDLILDLRARPIISDMSQQRHVESISGWLSDTIVKKLRGQRFCLSQF
jgi:hypothetical protein